jgi:hypothetical protein
MASDRTQAALEELRAALIEDGMDEANVDAKMWAVQPNETNVVGNFADLQRGGAAAPLAGEEAGSWEEYTKAELQAELDAQGIDYASGDTKADLIAKLGG